VFSLKLPVTSSASDAIKAKLTRTLPNVKSSHRCEAFARGLGFGTYASLLAGCRLQVPTIATANGAAFSAYLAAHGFNESAVPFYRAVGGVALRMVVEKVPKLTMWGIGAGRPRRKTNGKWENSQELQARFDAEREGLLSDFAVEPFLLSLALVARIKPTKTIRTGIGSYGLKHVAEKYACTYPGGEKLGPQYVANGVLIAAAVHVGFKMKTYVDDLGYDSLNVGFNMSKSAVEDLDCEIRPNGARAQTRRHLVEMRRNKTFYYSCQVVTGGNSTLTPIP
jgi:hypothetical protein